MAFTLTDMAQVLPVQVQNRIAKTVLRQSPLLAQLPVELGEGKDCSWQVQLDGTTTSAYTEGQAVGAGEFSNDGEVLASLGYGFRRSPFSITDELKSSAATSFGAAGEMQNVFQVQMVSHMSKLISWLGTSVFSGTGARNVIGLDSALLASAGTYAGINVSTAGNESFRSTVVDATNKTFLDAAMDALALRAKKISGLPSVLVCSPATASALAKSLTNTVVLNRAAGKSRSAGDAGGMVGASIYDLNIGGVPVLVDHNCADGSAYFLDLDPEHICLRQKLAMPGQDAAHFWMPTGAVSDIDGERSYESLIVKVGALGKKALAVEEYDMALAGVQLCVKNPAAHARIINIGAVTPP